MLPNPNCFKALAETLFCASLLANAQAAEIPPSIVSRLDSGEIVQLIVEYDDSAVEYDARLLRRNQGKRFDDSVVLEFKVGRYKAIKRSVDDAIAGPEIESIDDYSHLPMSFKRFHSSAALKEFAVRPEIMAIYEDIQLRPVLTESLPLINQPAVAVADMKGAGTTVAVIDNGIDFTLPAFGSCSAPGVPAGCHVSVSLDFGSGTTDKSHGTNVSAIVLGVAPDSRIAMLNAFSGTGANSSAIIAAINWAIANQASLNIVAINMSLGDSSLNTAQCSSGNQFLSPVINAKNAGISVVVASGNSAYTNGLAMPACTPGVISVGAVYDFNLGGLNWGICTDQATAADQVTCFSNSASYLSLLAPGALIGAAGIIEGGTSQASPHVAGAVAVLRAAFPAESLAQTLTRMTTSGVPITDTRNGLVKPRLNLLEAARPGNDAFSGRYLLSGSSGSVSGSNLLATREAGEPALAADPGGRSVWWKWTAPAAGQLIMDTHGSGFDTLLAVFKGASVNTLTEITSNDNDPNVVDGSSRLLLQTASGQQYQVMVDGAVNSSGAIALNWSLNTAAQANLSLNVSGPSNIVDGGTYAYTLTASNAGPQSATHVSISLTIPAGASLASGPANCTANANVVSCDLGTLESGASAAPVIQITWNSVGGSVAIAANIGSDLPDPNNSNNSTSLTVLVSGGSTDNDAPTLPEWGMLSLAVLLLGAALRPGIRQRTLP